MSSESEQVGYLEPDGSTYTAGHSGSDTSRERAISEAASGVKAKREKDTLWLLGTRRIAGLTVKEVRDITGWHHGQASSVLSTLHKAGKIDRLTVRRDRCAVYVLHGYADGRETVAHGRKQRDQRAALAEAFEAGFQLGSEDETWDSALVMMMFNKWMEQR